MVSALVEAAYTRMYYVLNATTAGGSVNREQDKGKEIVGITEVQS